MWPASATEVSGSLLTALLPVQLPARGGLQQSGLRWPGSPETRSAQRPDHCGYWADCIVQVSQILQTSVCFSSSR